MEHVQKKSERKLGLQETFKNLSRYLRPGWRLGKASANRPDNAAETGES